MRRLLSVVLFACACASSSIAQISVGIAVPGVSIGIYLPLFPQLVAVPGYPVYYAPGLGVNYFFHDGMYWLYHGNNWYASAWYNGPWTLVAPLYVPVYLLRVPVRYYRVPPPYFRPWRADAPPRWGEYWGSDWQRQRSGWDRWDRHAVPAPAPLPVYQRHYTGDRYPQQVEQQRSLNEQNYRYRPKDPIVQEHYQAQAPKGKSHAPGGSRSGPTVREPGPQGGPGTAEPRPQPVSPPPTRAPQQIPPAPQHMPPAPQGPGPREQPSRPGQAADGSPGHGQPPQAQTQASPPPHKGSPQGKGNGAGHGQGSKPQQ
jgi:hypothetical protein